MARPQSTDVNVGEKVGKGPKPFYCQWRETNAQGVRKPVTMWFATMEQALEEKQKLEDARTSGPSAPPLPAVIPAKRQAIGPASGDPLAATAPKGSLTLDQLGGDWLTYHVSGTAPASQVNYENTWRNHIRPHLGALKVRQDVLTKSRIVGFIMGRRAAGLSWGMQKYVLAVLSNILGYAVLHEHLLANPCDKLKVRLKDRSGDAYEDAEPNPLSYDECEAFLTWIATGTLSRGFSPPVAVDPELRWQPEDAEWYDYFLNLRRTGMRQGEAAGQGWDTVYLEHLDAKGVPAPKVRLEWNYSKARKRLGKGKSNGDGPLKGKRQRNVGLAPDLVAVYREKARTRRAEAGFRPGGPSRYVWMTPQGVRALPGNAQMVGIFDRGMAALGLTGRGHTPHDLRHTYATCHLMGGSDLLWVSTQLGHKNAAITAQIYAKWRSSSDEGQDYLARDAGQSASALTRRRGVSSTNRRPIVD